VLHLARRYANRIRALLPVARSPRLASSPESAIDEQIEFRCNLCGTSACCQRSLLSRETISCPRCGSTVRFRAIADLVVREVLGVEAALPDLAPHPEVTGLGLSDADAYAHALASKFTYENTYYHTQPRFDITDVAPDRIGRYDFVTASDVFEHVAPPVARAFVNARRLLKPGGRFIFTVPFTLDDDTIEHYPDLHDYRLIEQDGRWQVHNTTARGETQRFDDPVFHGGPGTTLEMRLFSRAALERHFLAAGFARVRVAAEPCEAFGIVWPEPWSVPMVAYVD
jgi:SAM-dependent methyltransferase